MREITGDIWDYYNNGSRIVIPTNLTLDSRGRAVMGAGLAKEARNKYRDLPKLLGDHIKSCGCMLNFDNPIFIYPTDCKIICLATKRHWRGKSDIELIKNGLINLDSSLYLLDIRSNIYLPRLGCGLGGLDWEKEVKPELEKLLDDRFIIVNKGL